MRKVLCVLALCAAWSAPTWAADNGIYFGAGLGQASLEVDFGEGVPDAFDIDDDDTAWKLIAGIRPLDWLAVEANYVNFGEVENDVGGTTIEYESDGISAFVVGFLAVGPVDLYGKAGLISWNTSAAVERGPRLFDEDGTDLAYGAGVQFRIWGLSARAEYEIFDIDDVENLSMISLGLTYTFL